ncbi:MAG: hypothetical protein GYB65_07050 [Chloroflexi bacterium]|nr:hypothetical protein [Chloroflexota bacterium]
MHHHRLLSTALRRCMDCSFADPGLGPLSPALVPVPITAMFIGEGPGQSDSPVAFLPPGTAAGDAFDQHYLAPLGLQRDQVWLTTLLKCRYPPRVYGNKPRFADQIHTAADICAHHWLVHELDYARPRVVVSLGNQGVYQRLRELFALETPLDFEDAVGHPHAVNLDGWDLMLFPLVDPDVSRPPGEGDQRRLRSRERWAELHHAQHIPVLRAVLEELLVSA